MFIRQTPAFHNPNEPLRNALSGLPSYDAHVLALEALKVPRAATTAAQQDAAEKLHGIAVDLAETLLKTATGKTAALIGARTVEATAATEAAHKAAATAALIDAVENKLGTELDNIVRPSADHLLSHLNNTLRDAYARSRELGLEGISDAEAAITADRAPEWAAMLELRALIFQTRDAQRSITASLGPIELSTRVKSFGILANYANLFPGFHEKKVGARYGREDLTPPWPTLEDGETVDPAEMHQWILDNPEAEPWVPTITELTATVKAAEARARNALDKAAAEARGAAA